MKILKYSQLKELKGIGWTKQHIRRLEKAGTFPQHVEIGPKSIGWLEAEIDAWIKRHADARASVDTHAQAA